MDAGNLVKADAAARGELHCIGATTLDESTRKYIEKDAALTVVSSQFW